jgi:uncharacterized protein
LEPTRNDVRTADDDPGREVLSEEECRRLLSGGSFGHLAYTDGALPAILPTTYVLRDGQVVVATRRDGSLAAALRGAVVAFGIDSWDRALGTGWGVNVVGPTRLVTDPAEVRRFDDLAVARPQHPGHSCYVVIRTELVHGWRTTAAGPDPVPSDG